MAFELKYLPDLHEKMTAIAEETRGLPDDVFDDIEAVCATVQRTHIFIPA